jgi:hypothetical protein
LQYLRDGSGNDDLAVGLKCNVFGSGLGAILTDLHGDFSSGSKGTVLGAVRQEPHKCELANATRRSFSSVPQGDQDASVTLQYGLARKRTFPAAVLDHATPVAKLRVESAIGQQLHKQSLRYRIGSCGSCVDHRNDDYRTIGQRQQRSWKTVNAGDDYTAGSERIVNTSILCKACEC